MNNDNYEQTNVKKTAKTMTYEEYIEQCVPFENAWKVFEEDISSKKMLPRDLLPRLRALTVLADDLSGRGPSYPRMRDVDLMCDIVVQKWIDTLTIIHLIDESSTPDLSAVSPLHSSLTEAFDFYIDFFRRICITEPRFTTVENVVFKQLFNKDFPKYWVAQSGNYDPLLKMDKDLKAQNRRKNTRPKGPPPAKIDSLYKELKKKVLHSKKEEWRAQSGLLNSLFSMTHGLNEVDGQRVDKLINTLEKTNSLARDVTIDAIKDVGQKFGTRVGSGFTTGLVNTTMTSVTDALSAFCAGQEKEAAVLLATIFLYYLWSTPGISNAMFGTALVTVGLCLRGFGCGTVFQAAFDAVVSVKDHVFQAQALDKPTIMDLVSVGLAGFMFPSMYFKPQEALRNFQGFNSKAEGFSDAIVAIVNMVQSIMDFVATKCGMKSYQMIISSIDEVDKWAEKSKMFMREYASGTRHACKETHTDVCRLLDEALELTSKFSRNRETSHIVHLIKQVTQKLVVVANELEMLGVGSKQTRPIPLSILLTGESQIGKSEMIRPLTKALLCAVVPKTELERVENDLDSQVYARTPETVYWDGYHGQRVTIFDEMHMVPKQLATPENASSEFVRCSNTFPYLLHMASMEQKGRTYFKSEVVLATTNIPDAYQGAESFVSYPEAVSNRFHFQVLVSVKPEFATAESLERGDPRHFKLDQSKLPSRTEFCWDVHEFTLLERTTDPRAPTTVRYAPSTTSMNMVQFLELMVLKYRELHHRAEFIPVNEKAAFDVGMQLRTKYRAQAGEPETDILDVQRAFTYSLCDTDASMAIFLRGHTPVVQDIEKALMGFSAGFRQILYESHDLAVIANDLVSRVSDLDDFYSRVNEKDFLLLLENVRVYCPEIIVPRSRTPLQKMMEKVEATFVPHLLVKKVKDWAAKYLPDKYMFWIKIAAGSLALVGLFKLGTAVFGSKDADMIDDVMSLSDFQAQSDQGVWDIMESVLKNYYSVSWPGFNAGLGFFLSDTKFCFNRHFIDVAEAAGLMNADITCTAWVDSSNGAKYTFNIPPTIYKNGTNVGPDLMMVELPHVRKHKDISNRIVDANVLLKKGKCEGLIVTKRTGRQIVSRSRLTLRNDFQYSADKNKVYQIPLSYTYDVETRDGDCGSPVFLVDPTTRSQKFIGIHVAGNGKSGCCELLCNQEFEKFTAQSDAYIAPAIQVDSVLPPATRSDTSIEKIGTVSRGPGTSGISKIIKSPLHNTWMPARKTQAKLRPFINSAGERVKPFSNALARYDQPILTYPQEEIDCVADALKSHLVDAMGGGKYKKVSFEDAQLGAPGVDYLDSMNRKTSPGYPFNMDNKPGFPGKTRFYGVGPDITLDGPDMPLLQAEYDKAHDLLKKGVRPSFIFADALKDEVLKHEKVAIGHTRLMCPSPIVYQILWNEYFKEFFVSMMNNRGKLESKVGINVYSEEWEMLYRSLTSFGPKSNVAGDFKSFDALQSAQILEKIGEIVISFFEDTEHNEIRRLLWKEVFDSRHIVGKGIYVWRQSLPSGHPATSLINCLFNSFIFRMAYYRAHDRDPMCLRDFVKHVILAVYGDDNICGISEVKRDIFNQHTLTEIFASMGLHFTAEDKSSDPPKTRDLHECEFLKRHFRWENLIGRHVAPLRLDSILEMPFWTKKDSAIPIAETNVENAIKELALHDPSVFDKWSKVITDTSMEKLHFVPAVTSRIALVRDSVKWKDLYAKSA